VRAYFRGKRAQKREIDFARVSAASAITRGGRDIDRGAQPFGSGCSCHLANPQRGSAPEDAPSQVERGEREREEGEGEGGGRQASRNVLFAGISGILAEWRRVSHLK